MLKDSDQLILKMLAQRHDKKYNWWHGAYWYEINGATMFPCFICNKDIYLIDYHSHGLFHLKEYNLLAFI